MGLLFVVFLNLCIFIEVLVVFVGVILSGFVCYLRFVFDWVFEGVFDFFFIIFGLLLRFWSGMVFFFLGNGSVIKFFLGGVFCGLFLCEIFVVGLFEDRGRFFWRGISGFGGVFLFSLEKNIGDGCDEFFIELCFVGVFMFCDLRGKKIII